MSTNNQYGSINLETHYVKNAIQNLEKILIIQ